MGARQILPGLYRITVRMAGLPYANAYLLADEDLVLIDTWIEYKRLHELDAIRLRPHPHEFALYFDI